jgi:hypothetical protein
MTAMPKAMGIGFAKATAAVSCMACATALASACSSAPPQPHPASSSTSSDQAYAYAPDAIVQCLVAKGAIPQKDLQGQPWLRGGTVQPGAALTAWLQTHAGNVYGGKQLTEWVDQARQSWPASYCGPSPAPTAR